MKIKYRIRFAVFIGIIGMGSLLASCDRANHALPVGFFPVKGTVGLVWSSKSLNGDFYRDGDRGLLEAAVGEMTSGSLPGKLRTVTMNTVMEEGYLKKYGDRLGQQSIKAYLVQLPLDQKNFKSFKKSNDQEFEFDVSEFKSKYGLDYVVYVEVVRFGVAQGYYGLIPTTGPLATCKLNVVVVDTRTNKIEAEYHAQKQAPLSAKWERPPDYSEAVQASKEILVSSLEDAYVNIFNAH